MSRTAWALTLVAVLLFGVLWWLLRKAEDRRASERGSASRGKSPPTGTGTGKFLALGKPKADAETNGRRQMVAERGEELKAIQAAISRANQECVAALEAGDAHAYAQHFADDAMSLPGRGAVVRGRTAIEEAMEEAFHKAHFSEAEWQTLDTQFNGKTAYETGAYKFIVRPAGRGGTQQMTGRYFIVWKKVGDQWKIVVDAAQPGAPPE